MTDLKKLNVNIIRKYNIIPTFTGFADGEPDNLQNASDGNSTTVTGFGTKILGAAGDVGYFIFTLPHVMNIMVAGIIGGTASASSMISYISSSKGGVPRGNMANSTTFATALEMVRDAGSVLLTDCDEIRIRFYGNGAATYTVRIYEIIAYEVGL